MVKDFRPISLIGSLYKIIAKVLANRLVDKLGSIVNEVQSAFVKDRQILDGPFILDELIQWCKKKRKHLLVFKVDFEKAFDSVRWDFLDDLLFKFGFGGKWRKWIQSCLRSSRGSIILNGSPTEEFQFHKGLKQGDPLSPLLFILVMESLHLSFNRVEEAGLFNGIQLNSSINISHLFYADDAVFVGQWCEKNINTLVHILECFFRASGLRINMSKSKLMGLNVDNGKIKEAALKLGCLTLKPPFTYLGSTVGGSMSRIQAWDGVVERVKSRLSKWKVKMLSIGGRLTLLKSVLGSMAIYQMSIHKAPLGVLRNLESLRSHFFNGCAPNNQKASWVNWKNALASKEKGGLGISSLYALNRGLMFKWYWRFFTKDSSLWSRVIKAIYGDSGGLERNTFATYTSCWSNIVKEVTSLDEKGLNLYNAICFKLGNELCKDCTVASKICDYTFDSSFRRPPRGGVEQEQFMALLSLVKDIQLVPMEDRWSWSLSSSGEFSVSSVRRLIDDKTLPDATQKTRWVRLVPIKINVHAWKVKSNSLPTRFNISRRGILIDSLKCGTCDMGVETVNHLFFSCTLVHNLVDLIVRWWNVTRVDIDSYSDWELWIQNLRLPIKNKRMLEVRPNIGVEIETKAISNSPLLTGFPTGIFSDGVWIFHLREIERSTRHYDLQQMHIQQHIRGATETSILLATDLQQKVATWKPEKVNNQLQDLRVVEVSVFSTRSEIGCSRVPLRWCFDHRDIILNVDLGNEKATIKYKNEKASAILIMVPESFAQELWNEKETEKYKNEGVSVA
ncbi:RNA-directed DNA polymerase, eukaryota, reverse transcriptase zinc-binding domain protein [Tanacetum coccineum]